MKRLKNIEGITKGQIKSQLKPIENDLDSANKNAFKKLRFLNELSLEAKEKLNKIKELDREIDYTKLVCVHTNGNIYYADILIKKKTMDKQDEMEALLRDLDAYRPQNKGKKQSKKETLNNTCKLFKGREITIDAFEDGFFPLPKMLPSFQGEDEPQQSDQPILPEWVRVTKNTFDKIKSTVTKAKKSGLSIKIDNKEITRDDAERLVKGIASGKINKDEAGKMFSNIMDDIDTVHRSKATKNQTRMLKVFTVLSNIFTMFSTGGKTSDKAGDEEADHEQSDTTDRVKNLLNKEKSKKDKD